LIKTFLPYSDKNKNTYLSALQTGQIDVKKWRRIEGFECRFEVRRTLIKLCSEKGKMRFWRS